MKLSLKILPLLSIFFFNCVNITQFIDVDDMLLVKAGATKQQLLTTIGKPSMVRAGLRLKNNDVHEVWFYKVRKSLTKQVLDFNRLLPAFILPGMKPKKDFKGNGWSGKQMYGFMFKNDKLYKWGFAGDDWVDFEEVDGEYLGPHSGGGGGSSPIAAAAGGGGLIKGILSKIPVIGSMF
tara:strand:- start:87 stop:623 length:537 start_codon:yes stop_codon:yes gene_type:complete